MSFSDSESSSHGGVSEYKCFRQFSRDRLLHEMLGSTRTENSKSWKVVLIMDKVTVKVMSHSCKMADITDQEISCEHNLIFVVRFLFSCFPNSGVFPVLLTVCMSLLVVEDLFRRREPLPSMDVIYFIQPTKENIVMFLSDMSGREPLYRNFSHFLVQPAPSDHGFLLLSCISLFPRSRAFIFFSSPIPKELVNHIKSDTSVLPRIGALREMNLEYFPIDNQVIAFITDQDRALEELFGDVENSKKVEKCLNIMATRIATVFASMKELPYVRYRASKALDESAEATPRDLIPTKLATAVWEILSKYKSSIPNFPQKETCDLLILDRTVDQIAPVIHEWTYDAMCHDLLNMDGNKYVHEVPSKTGGDPERKEVLLEDNDPVWLEIRHTHIADASERLSDKFSTFQSKNKAAQLQQSARDGNELSTRDLQKMVQALPQYTEQMEKISLHVEGMLEQNLDGGCRECLTTLYQHIAGKLNKIIRETGLRDLGQLEQDLVFGDAGAKDVINYLRTNQDTSPENKLRLLMIYASVYPEKFEGDKANKLMQLARLSHEDMKVVDNMRSLKGSSDSKKTTGSFSLKFNNAKTKQAARKDREGEEEETWQLFRFFPLMEELIENLNKGLLPKDEYSCMNEPGPTPEPGSQRRTQSTSERSTQSTNPHSIRSRRTANWGRARHSDDGYSSDSILRGESTDFKKLGKRIFVFMIGGATRSELRVCYKMTTKLKREVILGTTGIQEPPQYITKLKLLSEKELSVDGLKL
ncbi:putative sec1-like protein [Rosa chinensis]|uniref:Putative sec1-like protein n=1 Tax=Rosa chinensis TaxID=74649 RepID=A0A2P6SG28_ROSCH|nr:putative sec1-like protein [Rosa chinensis]